MVLAIGGSVVLRSCGPGPREECFSAVPAIGRSVSARTRPQANVFHRGFGHRQECFNAVPATGGSVSVQPRP